MEPFTTWSMLCREQNAKLQRPATEEESESEIFVPCSLDQEMGIEPISVVLGNVVLNEKNEKAEVTRKFEHQEFLIHLDLGGKQAENTKNVAIIGEPGAGKTTLLAHLAQVIDENQGLAICISLGSLEAGKSLENHLEEKWLKNALEVRQVSETVKNELADRVRQGDVWLLLDGLDEMQASSPFEALTRIEQEVRSGYLQRARVVLTCRVNVWDANLSNPLRKFETYKTLGFAEGQRDDFIRQWFGKKSNLALGEGLIAKLKESRRERICELVKNPLRLVVLCSIWTLQAGELPETKAEFYQRYWPYFYEWKKEVRDLTQDDDLQESLHQALGKLAVAGIESGSRYRLSESLAVQEMGEDYFQLAVNLGWLNIVDREQGTDEAVYAFFHSTFQEFFGAYVVDDWDFFLPRDHVDRPVEGKVYRIFESKWKGVILLWLGRADINNVEKEAFIQALINFDDGCGHWNLSKVDRGFYGYKAYYLAAAGIVEFKTCLPIDEIVNTILTRSFGHFNPETENMTNFLDPIEKSARKILPETDRTRASIGLINVIQSSTDCTQQYSCMEAAWNLGEIGYGNEKVITGLIDILQLCFEQATHDRQNPILGAAYSLAVIDPGNEKAIAILMDHLSFHKSPVTNESLNHEYELLFTQKLAAYALGGIDPGNETAIAVLMEQIQSSSDGMNDVLQAVGGWEQLSQGNKNEQAVYIYEMQMLTVLTMFIIVALDGLGGIVQSNEKVLVELINIIQSFLYLEVELDRLNIRVRAAEVLMKIGQGNEQAITLLTELLLSSSDEGTRKLAALILGEIGQGNEKAITLLTDLFNSSTCEEETHRIVAWSLAKIGRVSELIHLLFSSHEETRSLAVERLGKIGQGNQEAITALIDLLYSLKRNQFTLNQVAESLGEIGQGNQKAITALIDFLFSPSINQFALNQVAESLEKIGQGNQEAITVLTDLLSSPDELDELTRYQAAQSLERIDPGNQEAITVLRDILQSPTNDFICAEVASRLGRIDTSNQEAIAALTKLLSSSNKKIYYQAASYLEQILQKEQMPGVVTALKDYLSNETYQNNFDQFDSCYKVLWKCAQTLSYSEFYQAWYSE